MFAVIETGGKQYKVQVGDEVRVELLEGKEKDVVTFDRVLMVSKDGDLDAGRPYVKGGAVKAQIMAHGKGVKVMSLRHKARKGVNVHKGHRQPYTQVKITEIVSPRA